MALTFEIGSINYLETSISRLIPTMVWNEKKCCVLASLMMQNLSA